jgi:tRNA threonylcarbamoyladenosine biosynthesis protein TsaB
LLASIEVSTRLSSVALLDLASGKELGERMLSDDGESSVTLIPALQALLLEKGLGSQDLTAVAVSTGPGSFTGIRVGLATAEGICMPSNLPAFGISTLEGIAENLRAAEIYGESLCLIDAQRGECFAGRYEIQKESITETATPCIWSVEKLDKLLRGKTCLAGPGAVKYEKEIQENLGGLGVFAPPGLHQPRAMSIARLAFRDWGKGRRPTVEQLKPLYLRLPSVDEK